MCVTAKKESVWQRRDGCGNGCHSIAFVGWGYTENFYIVVPNVNVGTPLKIIFYVTDIYSDYIRIQPINIPTLVSIENLDYGVFKISGIPE